MKANKTSVYIAILIVYVAVLLCVTLLTREYTGKFLIRTEWFWGYRSDNPRILYGDNLINILLFIPVGCLVGLIASKHKLLAAVLTGLFLSETIECSQLIWHRGSFDVDDLFNNTVGAFLGSLIIMLTVWIRKKKKRLPETPLAE